MNGFLVNLWMEKIINYYFIYLYVLTFLLKFSKILSHKHLLLPFELENGKIFSSLIIGHPIQNVYRQVDLLNSFTWTVSMYYNKQKSETYSSISNETITIESKLINSELVCDRVNIDYFTSIESFCFYLVEFSDIKDLNGDTTFAFGYKIKNESFSLVHQLNKDGFIGSNSFFIEGTHDSVGKIHFGDLTKNELSKYPYTSQCKVEQKYEKWGCKLYSFQIGYSFTYFVEEFENYFYFDTGIYDIFFPQKAFYYLFNKFKYFSKNCELKPGSSIYSFSCPKKMLNSIKSISFNIGGFLLPIKIEELFFCGSYNLCRCIIQYSTKRSNDFTFGSAFYWIYIVGFHYNENSISFFSSNPIDYIGASQYLKRLFIIIFLIFQLFGVLMLLLLLWINNGKHPLLS